MPTPVYVCSIRDQEGGVLAFDLKDVLLALKRHVKDLVWRIAHCECTPETVCQWMQDHRKNKAPLSSEELLRLASDIIQTIDATIVGMPNSAPWPRFSEVELLSFPTSPAQLVIRAIDSSYFEVYAKDPQIAEALRGHFKDVRIEDPQPFFA